MGVGECVMAASGEGVQRYDTRGAVRWWRTAGMLQVVLVLYASRILATGNASLDAQQLRMPTTY
jgi:hypothetical protein